MDNTGGVNVFQSTLIRSAKSSQMCTDATHQNLIEEVLDELLLEGAGCKEAVKIGSKKLRDEVARLVSKSARKGKAWATNMSSKGEMKMSLRLMTCELLGDSPDAIVRTPHILMSQVLEQLQLSVCPLGEHRGAERFHNLFDGHGLAGELVLGRTAKSSGPRGAHQSRGDIPDKAERAHAHRLKVGVPLHRVSQSDTKNI